MSWQYFTRAEFACKCGCGRNEIDDDFITELDELRALVGEPLIVESGYRCPVHNARVSSTGDDGPHTTGEAADLRCARLLAYRVLDAALSMGFTGIGINQKGDGRFIHLDTLEAGPGRPRPTVWTY